MDKEVLIIVLSIFISLLMLLLISWIVEKKTRGIGKRWKIHEISSEIFHVVSTIFLIWIAIELLPIWIIIGIIGTFTSGLSLSNFSTSSSGSSIESYKKKNDEVKETKEYEKRYYHYDENYTSSIYDNNTVIRSDGVSGYRSGDFIYYNDDSMGHILDEDNGIIEKWQ